MTRLDKAFFKSKNVLIMGLGRFGGGVDVAKFMCSTEANVLITDLADKISLADSIGQLEGLKNIKYRWGKHCHEDFSWADVVVYNPAVPAQNEFLRTAEENGSLITSQVGIFFELCPCNIIGITGSNGKSTTTALTTFLLKNTLTDQDRKVWLGGNIGNEPLLEIIDDINKNDIFVMELSSFQIEQLEKQNQAPHISLITNLMPNHLDRYGSFEKYCQSKMEIFACQIPNNDGSPISIFNAEDKITLSWYENFKHERRRRCLTFSADDVSKTLRENYRLPGRAYLSNLAAALSIVKLFEVEQAQIPDVLDEFKGLPHRLEFIAEHQEIRWYNDSKATTPESAVAAIDAFAQPKIIIAGGYDKKTPFDQLGQKIANKCKAALLIGTTADKIKQGIEKNSCNTKIRLCDNLKDAVEIANKLANPGDVVLLSPACASYDMYTNFQQRGDEFRQLVFSLIMDKQ